MVNSLTEPAISLLLATRGRTDALTRSVRSVFELADQASQIEMLFAFDRDDQVGLAHWQEHLQPWLDQEGHHYRALKFDPMGYTNLHLYNNKMAQHARGSWFVIWNDDAVMQTQGWDQEILRWQGQFRLLAFRTHQDHPYSIFPILPRKWFDMFGYMSPHPTQDGWLSQQAYLLNILERIPVWVEHDRYDLTGNNLDDTYRNRKMLEGQIADPRDFHSREQTEIRHRDAARMAQYLREQGHDMTFWDNIWKGRQDPWERLKQNDTNHQMVQFASSRQMQQHFATTGPALTPAAK